MRTIFALSLFVVFLTAWCQPTNKPNVLFIAVDDLRPEFGAYGHPYALTPNIDKLAKEGTLFQRAYVQQAICGPSRNSLLTGSTDVTIRPDETKVWNFINNFRETNDSWYSLPQYFRMHGYITTGMGKVFHPGSPPNNDMGTTGNLSWNGMYGYYWPERDSCLPKSAPFDEAYCFPDEPDLYYSDGQLAFEAMSRIEQLQFGGSLNNDHQPFFIALGFHNPHLDWQAPKKYLDLYPPADDIPGCTNREAPVDMPEIAFFSCLGLGRKIPLGPKNITIKPYDPIPVPVEKEYRRAYYGAVSYIDKLIGDVLQKLEDTGVANNTIVVLWVPWVKRKGGIAKTLTEFVDIFPTLVDLANLPKYEGLAGMSMKPAFEEPEKLLKKAAFSQFPRCTSHPLNVECSNTERSEIDYMGYTIRTEDWRYTEWLTWNGIKLQGEWDKVVGVELYNNTGNFGSVADFNDYENVNLANDATYEKIVQNLHAELSAQFGSDK